MSGKVIGMQVATDEILDIARKPKKKIRSVLMQIGRLILKHAKFYVPRDTGDLARSGKITITKDDKGHLGVLVSFGDETAFYALWVHEDTTKYHKPPTRHHYLEYAVETLEAQIDALLDTLSED